MNIIGLREELVTVFTRYGFTGDNMESAIREIMEWVWEYEEDKPVDGQSAIREVEEDLQELRNKWIGETESFVEGVLRYAKMISLPGITDEEIEAMAEKEYSTDNIYDADSIQAIHNKRLIFTKGAKAIRDKLQSSVKDEDKKLTEKLFALNKKQIYGVQINL